MSATLEHQLDTQLDGIVARVEALRRLDLSVEEHLHAALQQSRDTLGALALYRNLLRRAADYSRVPQRQAA